MDVVPTLRFFAYQKNKWYGKVPNQNRSKFEGVRRHALEISSTSIDYIHRI